MAMDFFEAQECARKNSIKLVVLFCAAVVLILVFADTLLYFFLNMQDTFTRFQGKVPSSNLPVYIWLNLGVVLLIFLGTTYKISQLSGGGDAVALLLGGEPIFSDTPDPDYKRLLNIVSEMALASGVAVPQVYVLDEKGINAFAAGLTQSDMVIGITKGALDTLNREQLQGVIGHEFSHILSGDMRLKVRLAGVLHGIMLLGLIGRSLVRGGGAWRQQKGSFSVPLVGIALLTVGYAGFFCGNVIKAAICRQREYLADAAAVQFTRNPDGIGGALIAIGATSIGGLLRKENYEQMSHAFFCESSHGLFASLLASHPPLAERIKRILPDWDGSFARSASRSSAAHNQETPDKDAKDKAGKRADTVRVSGLATLASEFGPYQLDKAQKMQRSLPAVLVKATRDPFAARALIFFLLLDEREEIRTAQLKHLKQAADRGVYSETRILIEKGEKAQIAQKIPLVELALPSFRLLSAKQAELFLKNLKIVIEADKRITLFEWCIYKVTTQYVQGLLPAPQGKKKLARPKEMADACAVLYSSFAYICKSEKRDAQEIFATACQVAGLPLLQLVSQESMKLHILDQAINKLKDLTPKAKSRLLQGTLSCFGGNSEMSQSQWELMRGVSASLAVPMPPLVLKDEDES